MNNYVEVDTNSFVIIDPGVPYNVSIAVINKAGEGVIDTTIHFTREQGMKSFLSRIKGIL